MMQLKQSNQETICNDRQLVDLQEKFEVLQVKNQTLDKGQKDLLVLLAVHDHKIKGTSLFSLKRIFHYLKSEELRQ